MDGISFLIQKECCNKINCSAKECNCAERKECYKNASDVENGLNEARNRLAKRGITKFKCNGNTCDETSDVTDQELQKALNDGDATDGPVLFRRVGLIPTAFGYPYTLPGWAGHSWNEIVCSGTGKVIATVDFWARAGRNGNQAYRPGDGGFGYEPNYGRPGDPGW